METSTLIFTHAVAFIVGFGLCLGIVLPELWVPAELDENTKAMIEALIDDE
jgi:hypothetical protein